MNRFLTFVLMFLVCFLPCWGATSSAQLVKFPSSQITVREAFSSIEEQSGYAIAYNENLLNVDRKVKLKEECTVDEAMSDILSGTGTHHAYQGKLILVEKNIQKNVERFSGIVKDESGPVPGAVLMNASNKETSVTDNQGRFSIKAHAGDVINVSMLGFDDYSFVVGAQTEGLVISLNVSSTLLDESVVVGYGTQKKVNLTGAISTVSSEKLSGRTATSLTHMLMGTVPGLNITMSSGRPGNSASINIRGINSFNGGNPLVLIDGTEGDLSRINPNDVESVSVIKDASAAAVYGARASFGVILVTTKNGSENDGYATVRYSGRFGFEYPTTSTDFEKRGYYSVYLNDLFFKAANGRNYTFYTEEDMRQLWARVNDKKENPERPWVMIDQREGRDTYVYYANTDWYHELFKDIHPSQQHNISLSGGGKHFKYFLSGGYNYEEGIFRRDTDKFNKYNFRSKVSFDINKFMTLSNNTSYYKNSYKYPGPSGVNTAFSLMTVHALASYPAHNPDGSSIGFTSFANNNYVMDGMLTILDNPDYYNKDSNDNFSSSTELTVKPIRQLEIKGNFTYAINQYRNMNRSVNTSYSRYPAEIITITNGRSIDRLQETTETSHYYATNLYATYEDTYFDTHHIKVMGGFNWETKHYKDVTARGYYLMSEKLDDLDLVGTDADGNQRMEVAGGQNEYALEGFFGRVNYDYAGRYLFEFNGRYDGTSRFAKHHRWGFFPSVSVGWRISEEKFFEPLKNNIQNLKIRYSFGSLGNQQVGYYDYIRKINLSQQDYLFGTGSKPTSATIGAPVASDLTWEKAEQHNIGIDASFLRSRLSFTGEAYIRDTKDMLTDGAALPASYGASAPKTNSADLRTKGYELSVQWRDMIRLAGKPFEYEITATFSDYITEVTKYDNPDKSFARSHYVGQRWGEIWGYRTDGLFKSDEEAARYDIDQSLINNDINSASGDERGLHGGDIRYKDLDGDKKITLGNNTVDKPGDREIIGNTQPRYNYGLNLGFRWLGFDFSVFFQGIGHMDWYPQGNTLLFWGPYARPYATLIPKDFHKKIWSEDNPDAWFPRPRGYAALGSNRSLTVNNDRYLQNIGYCRVKNLTLGYTLPEKLTSKAGMEEVRIYFSGENLFCFSGIKTDYIDPEMAQTNSQMRIYPWQRSIMFGIDLTF